MDAMDAAAGHDEEELDEVSAYRDRAAMAALRAPGLRTAARSSRRLTAPPRLDEKDALLATLASLKKEEAFWTARTRQDDTPAVAADAVVEQLLALDDSSTPQVKQDTNNSITQSRYWVRPMLFGDTSILSMFHALTLSSPVSVAKSMTTHFYAFSGTAVAHSRSKRAVLLTFQCEINVSTADYSIDSFSVVVQTPLGGGGGSASQLAPFLTACERDKDVTRALYGLSSYAELATKRWAVFDQVAAKYETSTAEGTWPLGHVLAFPKREMQLFVSWNITLEDLLLAEAKSDVQAYARSAAANKTDTLAKVNFIFTSLIREHGVFQAICTLHDILYDD